MRKVTRWLSFVLAFVLILETPSAIQNAISLYKEDHRLGLIAPLAFAFRLGWIWLFLWSWWKAGKVQTGQPQTASAVQVRVAALQRTIRIMKVGFLVFGVVLIYLMFRIPTTRETPVDFGFESVITLIALTCIAFGFLAPRVFGPSANHRDLNQSQSDPLAKWMSVSIVSLACFNACTLFGFVLHSLGARIFFVELTFAAGLISLLQWKPQAPPIAEDPNRS